MNDCPPYLDRLLTDQRVPKSQLPTSGRRFLQPLFDGGVVQSEMVGRGEVVFVKNMEAFRSWLHSNFPSTGRSWSAPEQATRAYAVALRRNSKAGGRVVGHSALQLRALDPSVKVAIDDHDLPVVQMTERFGIAACLVGSASRLDIRGQAALVENLECFLQAETILSGIPIFLNSAGRVSDRLIACLARSNFPAPLLHLPDYDPIGLDDYLRLRAALDSRVRLFIPTTLPELFATFGNKKLISEKPKNRALLERLNSTTWPCPESKQVFSLIKESGCGLEQESLLLNATL